MMDCNAYRILIAGYIDGEISEDETRMLKAHLQTCKACFAYLTRSEAMKIVMKRVKLLQDIPEVSPRFAQNITSILQKIVLQERPAFSVRVLQRYRAFVFQLVEKWVHSLRARPFAWITSVSCLLVLMAGVVFFDIFQTIYQQHPIQQYAHLSTSSQMPTASQERSPAVVPQEPPALVEESQEDISKYLVLENEKTRIIHEKMGPQGSADLQVLSQNTPLDQFVEQTEFIKVADEPVIHVAKSDDELAENYVYFHVLEVAQEHFLDDAVFVGYVQDALR